MARKTLIHKHTNLTTTTGGVLSPKLPTVGTLEKGEIAVNYKNGYETLSIENDAGEVIPFASWELVLAYISTLDNSIVHKSNEETITGNKTFTGTVSLGSKATAITPATTDNDTSVATTAFVHNVVNELPEPMIFKGSLGTGGTITSLPTASTSNEGFTYKVITDGTYANQSAKIGDTFISDGSSWILIPSGDEPSGTVTSVKIQATSPIAIDDSSAITASGTRTISHDDSGVTAGTYKSVTVDAKGHVTAGINPTTLAGYGITDAINTSSTAQTKAGNLTAAKFITSDGTNSQFVKGDGSLDNNEYLKFRKLINDGSNYLSTSSKYLKLTMPLPESPWMMTLGIVTYSSYVPKIYYVGGYNHSSLGWNWHSPTVIFLSSDNTTTKIYFGKNDYEGGDGKLWVAIPLGMYSHGALMENSSNYSSFNIKDITWSLLDANPDNWDESTNGSISVVRTVTGTGSLTNIATKLAGIAEGAEVNLNAFSNVKIGNTTIVADTKTDTLTLEASGDVTLTPDATNDKVTIAVTTPKKTSDLTNDSGFITISNIQSSLNKADKIYTVDLSVREDLLASPLSSNTLSALNTMRADQNSEDSLILFKAAQDGSTLVPAYITQYGSTFEMYLYYENKEICVTAGANVPALDWAVKVTELDKAYYVVNATFVEDISYPEVGSNDMTVNHYAEDIVAAYNEGKIPIISFSGGEMMLPFIGYGTNEEDLHITYFGISIGYRSYLAEVGTNYAILTLNLIPTYDNLGILTIRVNGTALVADSRAVNITSIPSSIVTQDSTHRFVTDTEKSKWNSLKGELSSEYEPSTLENENLYLAPGDTYEEAFSKLHKAILDDEETIAASLNELNDKIPTIDTELSETSENPVQNKVITQTILDNEYVTSTALNNLNNRIETKQNTLISGTNIKTINGNSLLGSGNITISGGGGSSDNFDIIEVNCNFRADINKDGSISTLDATSMILGGVHGTVPTDDVNNDGSITIADATAINTLVLTNSDANVLFNLETNPYSLITSSFTNSKIPILRLIFIGGNTFDIFVQKYSNNTYLGEGLYYVDVPANGEGMGLENSIRKIFVSISETSTIGIIGGIVTREGLATKQNTLVSGTNIKTINNESILGSGNITIQGGSGGGGDTNVIETVKVNGTALTPDANKAVDITVPTKITTDVDSTFIEGNPAIVIHDGNHNNAWVSGRITIDPSGSIDIISLNDLDLIVPTGNKVTYNSKEVATVDQIPSAVTESTVSGWGFTKNTGTVTGVKMNGTTKNPTSGVVDLGTVLTSFIETDPTVQTWAKNNIYFAASQAQGNVLGFDSMHFMKSNNYSTGVFVQLANDAGQYIDYIVTSADPKGAIAHGESTRQIPTLDYLNSTYYKKPSTGIPKSDLASAVQTSLGKADTALQSYTETDPVFTASVAHGITSSDISNWNSKTSNTGTITGITMNGSSKGTSGVVNLGTVITSETSLSKGTTSGSGNAVTDISVNGHTITLTKGSTFLTSHQNIKTINNNSLVGTGNVSIDTLPTVTTSDNGKILLVVNGAWTLVTPTAIYSGTSTPNNSTGNDGDLYLQTS